MAEPISVVLNAIPFVTSGLALVAFIAACLMYVGLRSIKADQEILKGTNDERKVEVIEARRGRLRIPVDKLGKKEAFDLAKGELGRMAKQDYHRFIIYVIGMGLLAIVTILSLFIIPPSPTTPNFQTDSISGIFCEEKVVQNVSASYFDAVTINLSKCNETSESGSKSYRIMWPAQNPRSHTPANRNGYSQCYSSDFSERAPQFTTQLQEAFNRINERIPCTASTSIERFISLSYTDLRDQSHTVGFVQSYNKFGMPNFDTKQVPTINLPRSDVMQEIDARTPTLDEFLIAATAQFNIPNIPRPN